MRTLLYTEMVTAAALVRGGARHLLRFDEHEHPVALQLGGSDPLELAEAARMGAGEGYDEVNLNVGCPSDRVQSGTFGAVLMKSPDTVVRCVESMQAAVDIPVTVKCRIGVDDQDPRDVLPVFLSLMRGAGIDRVAIHARKAWLKGLSPKENREVPPLDYPLVYDMAATFPELGISLNGGIESLEDAERALDRGVSGVMVGRAAYHRPWDLLGDADRRIFGETPPCETPRDAALAMLPHIERHMSEGGRLHDVTRHMLGLFHGRPGARQWRRTLSEGATQEGAGPELVLDALEQVATHMAA